MISEDVLVALREFVQERDWNQFHTPANLAKSISIEAAELLELFQWSDVANIDEIQGEVADVLTYCLLLLDKFDLNPSEVVLNKLENTRSKYPVEKSKGKSDKYDRL